ncbi:hypothetical protein [Sphingobacterium psychroaquaticum]|uniref:Uncharacterized protein n=1 Tax=Sphingobacterium psychroaquaticum TaxID=561061 RepID=A0A1X7JR71_9SPHI|nr:hypothetical protein [Sphingobacterium psychroaquaticum]QBQ41021.1 hypothetical protein E2P86_07605 [Sphingobacterium psychroaquaticum]SMG30836.1 hypothetical protein SAMN05660862_2093 [Sphingobacterium psychroaquaticum]
MPANKKYLTKSPWVRLSRILAGTAGGYAVMVSFHYCLTYVFPQEDVIATAFFTGYILWAFLLLWAFLETKVWRLYATYLGLTLLFALPYLFKLT